MALNRGDPLERIYAAMMDGGESVPVFPGYTIIERIGAGGFGVVYKAFDEKLQRICAVKLLLEDRAADPASRAAFLHEARVMARVRHPNVLAIYGILEHAGRQALCTEYIEGPPLSERVAEGPLPPLEVARVGMDLSSALQAAHAAGLVHRDVKTSNVLCDRNDRTVLADFGLGVFIAPERREAAAHGAAGSPLFMSPEQLAGGRVDARSDIFSLGVVLYNASTTVFPHTADDIPTLIERVATMTPPPLTARMPDFPPALQAVIMRALGKDPDARYQTAAAMGEALEACCREAAQARKTAGRRDTPRRSAKFAALLGAGAVLAAVLALWPGPDAEAPVFQVHAVPLADTVHGPAAPAARADGAKRLSVSFRADRDLRVYAIREYTETKKYLLCPPPGGGAAWRIAADDDVVVPSPPVEGPRGWSIAKDDKEETPGCIALIATTEPIGPLEDALPAVDSAADHDWKDRVRLKPASLRGLLRVLQELSGLRPAHKDAWTFAEFAPQLGGPEDLPDEAVGVWVRVIPVGVLEGGH